jgi:hypothetical protein
MKKLAISALVLVCTAFAGAGYAKDDHLQLSIQDAMNTTDAKDKLDGSVKFFFGDQKHPAPKQKFGTFTANRKTNAFGKSNEEACQRAFASAMIGLQDRAQKEGGNAVVGIKSVYKKEDLSSETEYICGAGTFVGGVALRGEVVKLP